MLWALFAFVFANFYLFVPAKSLYSYSYLICCIRMFFDWLADTVNPGVMPVFKTQNNGPIYRAPTIVARMAGRIILLSAFRVDGLFRLATYRHLNMQGVQTNIIRSHVAYLIWIICIRLSAAAYLIWFDLFVFCSYLIWFDLYSSILFVFVCTLLLWYTSQANSLQRFVIMRGHLFGEVASTR